MDGDSTMIQDFGQNAMNRSGNGKLSQKKHLGRSRSVSVVSWSQLHGDCLDLAKEAQIHGRSRK